MREKHLLPRSAICPALVFLLVALVSKAALAGLPHPASWTKVSDDGKYVLVMVSPLKVDEDAGHEAFDGNKIREIRARYSESGLYRNDQSSSPLWTIPYYSPFCDLEIAPDGKHLVLASTDWSSSRGCVATFYKSGNELATYYEEDLNFPFLKTRYQYGLYLPQCSASIVDWQAMTLTVRSNQGDEFLFDVTTGKILRQWSPWPRYVVCLISLVVIALMAFAIWIIARSRRRGVTVRGAL